MSKAAEKIKEEFLALLPPTIYFFVVLHIIALIRTLMTRGTGITLDTTTSVAIAALILGKSVLIADMLPIINRFPEKPLIWNVAWKTVIYFAMATFIHYLERLYDFWKEAPGFAAANEKLLAAIIWPHFWAVQILLATLILTYCVMSELVRVLGADRMKAMFFGPVPTVAARKT
jgi:hypothetical protein